MKKSLLILSIAICVFALGVFKASAVVPPTTYGTLDNFDVVNDTGVETHGFEIELEGISSTDVAYFFGAPYERYGDPEVVSNGAGGVIVRYRALYDSISSTWSAGTPTVSSLPPTDGHSCWSLGDPNYPNVGCDHFGVSLNATPTKTTYRWLIENPSAPGTLMVNGTNVPLPAPVWNVTPPADPNINQPIAAAIVSPLVPNDPTKCGEAQWVKVYTTELPNGLHEDDLEHMVVDDPNVDIVPDENDPLEVEFEWYLLQACPGEGDDEFGGGVEVGAGNEAVSRRFEFFKYTGQYDPDPDAINQAMCDNPIEAGQQTPERCGDPNLEGVAGVGDYIGKQNVAINLAGEFAPPNQPPVATANGDTTDEDTSVTFNVTGDDSDTDGTIDAASVDLDPVAAGQQTSLVASEGTWSVDALGNVTLNPALDFNGTALAGYTVQDNDSHVSNTAALTVIVNPVNDPPVADAGPDQSAVVRNTVFLSGSGTDVDGDSLTYAWTLTTLPTHTKATLTGATTSTPSFFPKKDGTYVVTLVVSDGTDSSTDTVTISVTRR